MEIAVVESDAAVRGDVAGLIRRAYPGASVRTFANGGELFASGRRFAIYFLDIHGSGGLEAALAIRETEEKLSLPKSVVIFITGYREHMEEAFDVGAFHYLVKPLDTEKFEAVLKRAVREAEGGGGFLTLKSGGLVHRIAFRDIEFIESDNKRVIVHMGSRELEASATMEALEAALGPSFFRCHRCFITNLAYVSAYGPDSVHLTNGAKLILARRKYSDFVRAYLRYARGGGEVHV